MKLPEIPEDQKTPLVQLLLRIIKEQAEEITHLKDEIAKLKGYNQRPKIPPSKVSKDAKNKEKPRGKNDSSSLNARKQRKKEDRIIQPNFVPSGSRFKGYEEYSVQDLRIESVEIKFRLAVYIAPDGSRIRGELPQEYSQGHFSAELQSYCITQYFQCHVTEPLLLEQLYEMGIDISQAELNNILIRHKEQFHQEKEEILEAGMRYSEFLNTDDTSSRHQGHNGYCTVLGSSFFCYFKSAESKSRVNFLQLLQGQRELYIITEESLNYAFENGLGDKTLRVLEKFEGKRFHGLKAWEAFLKKMEIRTEKDRKISTEAALVGGAFVLGINLNIPIVSDAARQFRLFLNALCWVHEERHYRKLVPVSEHEREEIEAIRAEIWDFYEELKIFKSRPTVDDQIQLLKRFDEIFQEKYFSPSINALIANTISRKEGLLLVLKYPVLPLHNNDCERDIREYAKRRKISGSTRSDLGREARDTFTSLKKTCRKLGVAFGNYVLDRLIGAQTVPRLSELIIQKAKIIYG